MDAHPRWKLEDVREASAAVRRAASGLQIAGKVEVLSKIA